MEIKHLQSLIKIKKLSKKARERLGKDLDAIYLRLKKNEYETSSLSQNVFDVSTFSEQFYKYMETQVSVARTWTKFLNRLPLHSFKEVVDLCPGPAPKIELALYYNNYKGKVVLLEENKDSTKRLIKFMDLINYNYNIVPLNCDLFNCYKTFDFVIGNHVIDDLVMSYFAKKFSISLNNIYKNEKDYKNFWKKVSENKKNSEDVISYLTPIFSRIIKGGGYLCLSQYKSFMEKMMDLDSSYKFSRNVLSAVCENLLKSGFVKVNIDIHNDSANYFSKRDLIILRKKQNA